MAKNLIEMERKVLLGFTGLTVFGILLMFVSFSTDYWMIVTMPSGLYGNASHAYMLLVTILDCGEFAGKN